MNSLSKMKREVINNAFEIRELNKDTMLVAARVLDISDLFQTLINSFGFSIIPVDKELSQEQYEKLLEGCNLLEVKPNQEYIAVSMEFEWDSEKDGYSPIFDFQVYFNRRTLQFYTLWEDFMMSGNDTEDTVYTVHCFDFYDSVISLLKGVDDLNFDEISEESLLISLLNYAYGTNSISIHDIYELECQFEDEEECYAEMVVEFSIPLEVYNNK